MLCRQVAHACIGFPCDEAVIDYDGDEPIGVQGPEFGCIVAAVFAADIIEDIPAVRR